MENVMTNSGELPSQSYRTAQVSGKKPLHFTFAPDAPARARIAAALNLLDLPEFTFKGSLLPESRGDVGLVAVMAARVVQPCAITLVPVPARLREEVKRSYQRAFEIPTADEMEIGPDDIEPLPETLDVAAIAIEALTLALPLYPRAKGAELPETVFAPPGITPLKDADLRPFAGLAGLAEAMKVPKADET